MSPPRVRAFLGLGSNLGDRLANLTEAVGRLGATEGVTVIRSSRVYETAAVGPPQPDYLNAVVEVETDLDAQTLLDAGLAVERDMGRVRGERWGPRLIDVDLLTYGREVVQTADLTIPHPRMHERAFVLVPLLELDPDPMLPGGRRVAGLRLEAGRPGEVSVVAPALPLSRSLRVPPVSDTPGSGTRTDGRRS